jgi:hypothetical protein
MQVDEETRPGEWWKLGPKEWRKEGKKSEEEI